MKSPLINLQIPHRLCLGLVILLVLNPGPTRGQNATTKPGNSDLSPTGFSIESEMLTYRALESNSEAIACEIAAYVAHTSPRFKRQQDGNRCDVTVDDPDIIVVLLPLDSGVISDFQIWRSDMQSMNEMIRRANCTTIAQTSAPGPGKPPGDKSDHVPATRGAFAPSDMLGSSITAAQTLLGLFATGTTSTAVGGTIQDQAFLNDVARDLSSLHVAVLSPSLYEPGSLAPIDPAKSPFLAALEKLMNAHDCLLAKGSAVSDPRVTNIEKFLSALADQITVQQAASPGPKAQADPSTSGNNSAAKSNSPSSTSSHLYAVLSADSLAQSLGANPENGSFVNPDRKHILLLKALESGGEVVRTANVLKTRITYSGGSVGTYALFGLSGLEQCSGNVYTYAGSLPSKNFDTQLRSFSPNPADQMIFRHGSCSAF